MYFCPWLASICHADTADARGDTVSTVCRRVRGSGSKIASANLLQFEAVRKPQTECSN